MKTVVSKIIVSISTVIAMNIMLLSNLNAASISSLQKACDSGDKLV